MNAESFQKVQALVRDRAAIVLEPGKEYLVETRLLPLVRSYGLASIDQLCERLSGEVANDVVEAMTTNETSFFRDHYPWEALREEVLPALIEARKQTRSLQIWCAAASTGQEPYSMAMLLRDHFADLSSWNIRIYATDINKQVLERARTGRYRQIEVNRGIPANRLLQYFERHGAEWELKPEIRKLVHYDYMNLAQSWPPMNTFDIILVRNVLIYFDQRTKLNILTRAQRLLASDGYLFLGGAESMPSELSMLERIASPRSGCYKNDSAQKVQAHAR